MCNFLVYDSIQVLLQLTYRRILRQLQSIETSVAFGVRVRLVVFYFFYCESVYGVSIAFQIFKTQNWNTV